MTTTTWTAPVATAVNPRIFMWDPEAASYAEVAFDAEPDSMDGRIPVAAHPVVGGFRLVCECYYSSEGRFELVITRPLSEALAIFAAALTADTQVEGGNLRLPTVAAVAA